METDGNNGKSGWRSRSKFFRLWCLCSPLWVVLLFLFVWAVDPFDKGSLERTMKYQGSAVLFYMFVPPLLVGAVKFGYEKFVR